MNNLRIVKLHAEPPVESGEKISEAAASTGVLNIAGPEEAEAKDVKVKGARPKPGNDKSALKKKIPASQKSEELFDLDDSQWYLNRELTWLEFNRRVLHEAEDERTPLLERLKFSPSVSVQPGRILHEADRRPQAADRRRHAGTDP